MSRYGYLIMTVGLGITPISNAGASPTWNAYLSSLPANLQKGCEPRNVLPKGPEKGVVILLHGFSACPQQFAELAENYLAPRGYRVYLPLLPGQGRPKLSPTRDDFRSIPDESNWRSQYGEFVKTLAQLATEHNGPRVIGGLSLGGALAQWTALEAPEVFDRALILAPLLRFHPSVVAGPLLWAYQDLKKSMAGKASWDAVLKFNEIGWGEGCEEGQPGRAGVCQFTRSQLRAVGEVGAMVLKKMRKTRVVTQYGIVGSDMAADSATAVRAAAQIEAFQCSYPAPVPHPLVSRFDQDGPWIPVVYQHATNFITNGIPYPHTNPPNSSQTRLGRALYKRTHRNTCALL